MLTLKNLNKRGQDAGGFGIVLPIVIVLMVTGFVLTILTEVNSDLLTTYGGVGASSTNASQVAARIGVASVSFAGNFGTFFSLALLAVIIGIVAIFLVRRA
jgi:hypothetical protein